MFVFVLSNSTIAFPFSYEEWLRHIKANPLLSGIKVLAVSGQHNSEKSRLIQDNADAFIEKPFEVSDLVEAVRRLALK